MEVGDTVRCTNLADAWAMEAGLKIGKLYKVTAISEDSCRVSLLPKDRPLKYWQQNSCFVVEAFSKMEKLVTEILKL